MHEMSTQQLKYLVSKNIGKNVGRFSTNNGYIFYEGSRQEMGC